MNRREFFGLSVGLGVAPVLELDSKEHTLPGLEEIVFIEDDDEPRTVRFGKKLPIFNVWFSGSGVEMIWGWWSNGRRYRARARVRDSSISGKKLIPLHIDRLTEF